MAKIRKVVYSAECSQSVWSSDLGCHTDVFYMGEHSWKVGDVSKGEFMQGTVTSITRELDGEVCVWVGKQVNIKLADLPAIVAQHECDHLDGKNCMDKATKVYG